MTDDTPDHEHSIAEEFRLACYEYIKCQEAADALEELKTTTLEQMKTKMVAEKGEMADNKAERLVKSGDEWEAYIRAMVAAKSAARRAKLKLEWIRIKERQEDRRSWLHRSEYKMGRSTP